MIEWPLENQTNHSTDLPSFHEFDNPRLPAPFSSSIYIPQLLSRDLMAPYMVYIRQTRLITIYLKNIVVSDKIKSNNTYHTVKWVSPSYGTLQTIDFQLCHSFAVHLALLIELSWTPGPGAHCKALDLLARLGILLNLPTHWKCFRRKAPFCSYHEDLFKAKSVRRTIREPFSNCKI